MFAQSSRLRAYGAQVRQREAFTLIELLVVMGVIALLSVLTLVAVRRIAADARLAMGTNAVVTAVTQARTLAIKEHKVVLVVFRSRLIGPNEQVVEASLAEWTGDTYTNNGPFDPLIDRFTLIPNTPIRRLPAGISVAGPMYHRLAESDDDLWSPLSHLPGIDQTTGDGETPGRPVGVMFGPNGSLLMRNSQSDSNRTWVDYNDDRLFRRGGADFDPADGQNDQFFQQRFEDDEPNVSLAAFLAVFDESDARERRALDWADQDSYETELAGPDGYITQFSRRIHFNRYSGVVMR